MKRRLPVLQNIPLLDKSVDDEITRREFLRLAASGLAIGALGGCIEPPRERIYPYSMQRSGIQPGKPRYYATTMQLGGYGTGLLVESHEGRPTKVEGNPDHPASLGAAGVYEQASVLQLYDPFRAKSLRYLAAPSSWDAFVREFAPSPARGGYRGAGLHFLLEPTASPLTARLLDRIRELYPESRIHSYAPLSSTLSGSALQYLFGQPLQPQYDLRNANVIVALDADVIGTMPFALRYARQFAGGRRSTTPGSPMNRLYSIESKLSDTGTIADHRFAVKSSDMSAIAVAILRALGTSAVEHRLSLPDALLTMAGAVQPAEVPWAVIARDLLANAGRSVVIPGEHQPIEVHIVAHAINTLLGNTGRTVWYTAPVLYETNGGGIDPLVDAIHTGSVDTLIILGGNPVYNAPAELRFRHALQSVRLSAYCGLYENETARACHWFVPALHYLESWGDARAYDGTVSLVQPLISPLYSGRTFDQVLAMFLGLTDYSVYDLLRESWRSRFSASDAGYAWSDSLRRGVVASSAAAPQPVTPNWNVVAQAAARTPAASERIELVFLQDAMVYDGSFGNNPWLQELPDPATKLTWDNAALLNAHTAALLGVEDGDCLRIEVRNRSITIPALINPLQADNSVAVSFGYGRTGAEAIARRVGVDVYTIWPASDRYVITDVSVSAANPRENRRLATTQKHWALEGRPIVLHNTLNGWGAHPDFTRKAREHEPSLYKLVPEAEEQWAMTIDLGVCTGCSACVVACQAENNIPVVGRSEVLNNREMHWLRIDRYYADDPDNRTYVQPMLCQHCEKAPCEYVCPVNATVHSDDGLNEMVYNRCVGTRFCSNNCPYKVRRFNWYNYNAGWSETEQLQFNPDVTVRARGVMEKCTYCVQRIREAEIQARIENRRIRDGEVVTACQQACPTRAIVFGSMTDPEAEVTRSLQQSRIYSVLNDLGTQPRTRYLARISNPNPAFQAV